MNYGAEDLKSVAITISLIAPVFFGAAILVALVTRKNTGRHVSIKCKSVCLCSGFWRIVDNDGVTHEIRSHPSGVIVHRYKKANPYVVLLERGNLFDQRLTMHVYHVYINEDAELSTSYEFKKRCKNTIKLDR